MILNRMNTEGNIILTVEEIATSTLKVENNECDITDKQVSQKTQNTVIYTKDEQNLDRQIRATINRNIIRQRQLAYLQALQIARRQRKRRFGLKFK